jgi:hypothetical protein
MGKVPCCNRPGLGARGARPCRETSRRLQRTSRYDHGQATRLGPWSSLASSGHLTPGQARQAPANLVTGEASLNRCGILFMIVLKAATPTALVRHSGGCWRSGPFARLRERRRVADRDLGACVSLGAGLAGLSAPAYIGRLKCARFRKADPKNEQWIFGEPPLACSDYHHQPFASTGCTPTGLLALRQCAFWPMKDQVLHAVINGSLSDVGRTAEPRPGRAEHLERKMTLATTRDDDLEDPEAVKAFARHAGAQSKPSSAPPTGAIPISHERRPEP